MTRLRRAPLFVPGDSRRKIEKSLTFNADSIILELEDGVAYSQKANARAIVADALQTLDFGHSERLVRINPLNSGLAEADLLATLPGRPDGYVIPKVENASSVETIAGVIGRYEQAQGWPKHSIKLLAIIESARGVVNLTSIATANLRLIALMFGAADLAGDIGAISTPSGHEVLFARSAVVTVAAAFDLEVIDSPYFQLKDPTGLHAEATRAMEMGYTGKMAIHPAQLETLHQVFSPSAAAIAQAKRLLTAYQAHQKAGSGVFTLDGKMIDTPMMRAAENIIQKAEALR